MSANTPGTVAVIGAGGMLGFAVSEYFARAGAKVLPLRRADFDIARDPLEKLVSLIRTADVAINCAGVIKPMIATTPIEDVLRVNALFPRNFAQLGARLDIPTFHVTTDCVFSGRDGGYDESSPFDADDVYGMSKCGGDGPFGMTLRTSIIGEEHGTARSLLEWARSQRGRTVKGFLNHRWNGVTTIQLAEVVHGVLEAGEYERKLVHVHSPDVVNKFELVSIINDVYGLGMTVQPVNADTACDRSLTSRDSLSARMCRKPIRQQIAEMREFFAQAATTP
jgi:dTDP-4-dehydrorhamnose reductase